MALEFNCPYCKAIIRVPDNSAGKRGKCPQCASRLSIPKLGATRRAGAETPFFPSIPEPAASLPSSEEDDVIFEEYDPASHVGIDPVVEAALAPGDVALPVFPGDESRGLPRPVMQIPDSVMSKVKSRRKNGWPWILITCLLLGSGAAGGFVYWFQQSSLMTGELTGQLVENPHLPAKSISRSEIALPPADLNKLLTQLQHNPSTLVSSLGLATVQFQGGDAGLLVSVSPGSATSLYRVELSGDAKLKAYRQEHARQLDQFRQEELSLAVNEYFRLLKKINAKQGSAAEFRPFRDRVGLAASVQGLGYFVDAVHQRQIFPCAYEDEDALYFLLPAGIKRFQLIGKPRKGSGVFFPGKYEVKVQGSIRLDDPAPEQPPTKVDTSKESDGKTEMPEEDDPEMTPE